MKLAFKIIEKIIGQFLHVVTDVVTFFVFLNLFDVDNIFIFLDMLSIVVKT